MISEKEYKKYPESHWVGKAVRLLQKTQNGYWIFPQGYVMKITRKYMGFDLESADICPTCGVGHRQTISRIPPNKIELISVEEAEKAKMDFDFEKDRPRREQP